MTHAAERDAYRAGWFAHRYAKAAGLTLEELRRNWAEKYPNPDDYYGKGWDDRDAGYVYYFAHEEASPR